MVEGSEGESAFRWGGRGSAAGEFTYFVGEFGCQRPATAQGDARTSVVIYHM